MSIVGKLKEQYEQKLAYRTGKPPEEIECDSLDKFDLLNELITYHGWRVVDSELYLFNANTKVVFI